MLNDITQCQTILTKYSVHISGILHTVLLCHWSVTGRSSKNLNYTDSFQSLKDRLL